MKLSEKLLKTVEHGYLYANGKLVLIHRQSHKQAGSVEWVTIHDASDIRRTFGGRLVLHNRGAVRLIAAARSVRAQPPALEHGSENTKRLGIAYGYVSVALAADEYSDTVHFPVFANLVSGDFTPQPENDWTEQETPQWWASYRVHVHDGAQP